MVLRNFTTQVNEGSLQMFKDQMFVEVFRPERCGWVHGYGANETSTKLWGFSSFRIHDLEKQLQESKQKKLEANVGITSRACWRHNNQQGNQIT